jgi:ADP-heptose:LPS heptosyltransferase
MNLNFQKILIIKLRYIGDSINLLPVVSNIKNHMPNVHVSVLINQGAEDVLAHSKFIDKVICYDRVKMKYNKSFFSKIKNNVDFFFQIRKEKYDLVRWGFDYRNPLTSDPFKFKDSGAQRKPYHTNPLLKVCYNHFIEADITKMHIVDFQLSALRQIGFPIHEKKLVIDVPEDIQREIERTYPLLKEKSFKVVIHPGARLANRRWPALNFAQIAKRLRSHYGAEIILVSAPDEKALLDEVADSIGHDVVKIAELSLIQLAAFIKKCDLYICNDTGTSNLAAGTGVRIVTLFGPQFPFLWAPYTDRGDTVFKNLDCTGPCNHIDCIYDENKCMTSISVDDVWEKIKNLLAA